MATKKSRTHSVAYLKEALRYDPKSGSLTWNDVRPLAHFGGNVKRHAWWVDRYGGRQITCVAANGYIVFNLNKVMYLAHRICFAIHHGIELPDLPKQIDHKDTCRTNNSAENLRPSDPSTNQQNRSLANSTSGLKGVTWGKQRNLWRSTISISGKQKHLGFFVDPNEAHEAYVQAANENFGEFARAA